MPTQRFPRLRHALLDRVPAPDRLVRDHIPNPRLHIEQNPFQDLLNDRPQFPGSRATLQSDPGDLLDRRIGEHQIRTVKPYELAVLLNQRILRSLKNPGKIVHAQGIQGRYHRQPSNDLRDQPELFQVFGLQLPQQPIRSYLAGFGHLPEPEPAPPETLGDDVFQPDECPTADKEDVGRVERWN